MNRKLLTVGASFALLSIVLGAFGAHWLKSKLTPEALATFEVGVRYQLYHSLALLIVGGQHLRLISKRDIIGLLFISGIILFSGSIYLLSLKSLIGVDTSWLGLITPIGGTLFILGWAFFILAIFKTRNS